MSAHQFYNLPSNVIDHFEALTLTKVLYAIEEPNTGKTRIQINLSEFRRVSVKFPAIGAMIQAAQELGASSVIDLYVTSHVWSQGPKVVVLGQRECEALEATTLNLSLADYNQPFETMIVEFPKDYLKNQVSCAQAGSETIAGGNVYPETHHPLLVLVRHEIETNTLMLCTHFTSGQVMTSLIYDRFNESRTIEELLSLTSDDEHRFSKSFEINSQEAIVHLMSMRAAVNTMLLLDTDGMRKIGPSNPVYYEKIRQRVSKNRRQNDRIKLIANERELRRIPVYYGFDHKTVVYTKQTEVGGGGEGVSPHWRSGHWRMQRHGVHNSLVKRIRIKPVLINAHLLVP